MITIINRENGKEIDLNAGEYLQIILSIRENRLNNLEQGYKAISRFEKKIIEKLEELES